MEQQETKPLDDKKGQVFKYSPSEAKILRTIGNGSIRQGIRIATMWAAHFYNLGLNPEMDLDLIGLVTVSSTDNHPNE